MSLYTGFILFFYIAFGECAIPSEVQLKEFDENMSRYESYPNCEDL